MGTSRRTHTPGSRSFPHRTWERLARHPGPVPSVALPLLTVAFVAGVWAADAGLLRELALRPLAVIWLLAGLARRLPLSLRAMLALAAFFMVGGMRGESRFAVLPPESTARGGETSIEAYVCGAERDSRSLRVLSCDVRAISEAPHDTFSPPGRILLGARHDSPEADVLSALEVGQRFRARVRIRVPTGVRNPGGRDDRRWLARRGLLARASLVGGPLVALISERHHPPAIALTGASRTIDRWRARIASRLRGAGPGGGLLAALSVGKRDALAPRVRASFVRLGLAHLLAVSGLHLALVAGAAYLVARTLMGRVEVLARAHDIRSTALAFAIAAAGLYAALCGFDPPVRRAWLFLLAAGLGVRLGRRLPAPNVLCIALMVIGLLEPEALFSVSLQLSFAASLALLMGLRHVELTTPRSDWLSGARSLVHTSALAIAATAPLLAWHGMTGGAAGLFFNLVAVPMTAFVMLPAALAAGLLAGVELSGVGSTSWLVGPIWIAERLAHFTIEAAVSVADRLPVSAPRPATTAASLAVAAALVFAATRTPRTGLRVALALSVGLWLEAASPERSSPLGPRMVALDVGQGDAVLVQGRSATLLVDGGRALPGGVDLGRSRVVPALAALGVRRLDLMVATHADIDHRGGLVSVLGAFEVGALWLPVGGKADPDFRELRAVATRRGVRVEERGLGDPGFVRGDLRVTPLWPARDSAAGAAPRSRNDRSLVVRVEVAGRRALLTGDIGARAESELLASDVDLSADLLKVAHHGSGTSSMAGFLAAVSPEIALLSAPCQGRSGLPHSAAISRLQASGARLGWTGRDGALLVALREPGVRLEMEGYGEVRESCARATVVPPTPIDPLVGNRVVGRPVSHAAPRSWLQDSRLCCRRGAE